MIAARARGPPKPTPERQEARVSGPPGAGAFIRRVASYGPRRTDLRRPTSAFPNVSNVGQMFRPTGRVDLAACIRRIHQEWCELDSPERRSTSPTPPAPGRRGRATFEPRARATRGPAAPVAWRGRRSPLPALRSAGRTALLESERRPCVSPPRAGPRTPRRSALGNLAPGPPARPPAHIASGTNPSPPPPYFPGIRPSRHAPKRVRPSHRAHGAPPLCGGGWRGKGAARLHGEQRRRQARQRPHGFAVTGAKRHRRQRRRPGREGGRPVPLVTLAIEAPQRPRHRRPTSTR